jgi:GGDEF domain-containing protein
MTLRHRVLDWLAHLLGRVPHASTADPDSMRTVVLPHREPTRVAPEHGSAVVRHLSPVDEQARELEALRRQAHTDAVTGLPNRRNFVGRLAAALGDSGTPGAGLLILRVLQLEGLNLRIGHDATDLLLAAVAEVLAAYPLRVPGAFAGRLNGTDFALYLPVSGVADETAGTLMRAQRAL